MLLLALSECALCSAVLFLPLEQTTFVLLLGAELDQDRAAIRSNELTPAFPVDFLLIPGLLVAAPFLSFDTEGNVRTYN